MTGMYPHGSSGRIWALSVAVGLIERSPGRSLLNFLASHEKRHVFGMAGLEDIRVTFSSIEPAHFHSTEVGTGVSPDEFSVVDVL